VLAWPGAEIGVLGARQAVGIIHRRTIEASADPAAEHDRLAADYAEEHLSAATAAAAGDVDEVIEPGETRDRLIWAHAALSGAN
jgi:acetyl-CoA carboxylase carboxyltransferase component